MDLFKLDRANFSYAPIDLIEDYSSLIWTERYRPCGDFELKTKDVDATRALLTLDSLVSIQGSTEAMFVENHVIEKREDGDYELTISGRSFETFLEHRTSRPDGGTSEPLYGPRPSDVSKPWVGALGHTGAIAADYIYWKTVEPFLQWGQTIPNFQVFWDSDLDTMGLPNRDVDVEPGELYAEILKILAIDNLGIRSTKPEYGNNPEMQIFIYAGSNKTATVQFSVSAGHFKTASYLWSNKNHKNTAHVFSYYNHKFVSNVSLSYGVGLNRKIGFVDATDIKTSSGTDANQLTPRGGAYLSEHPKEVMFDGEVSPEAPYKYKTDYALGDTVKVLGEYGVNQDMMVTEYTRIEDEEGERGYPTLSIPSDAIA